MFCYWYRWRIEKELDDHRQIRSRATRRHASRCPSCRGWLEALTQIEAGLQSTAPEANDLQMQRIEAGLQQRLDAATVADQISDDPSARRMPRVNYALSAAAAILVILAGSLLMHWSEDSDAGPEMLAELTQQIRCPFTAAMTTLADNTIQSELDGIRGNVSGALTFLRQSVPGKLMAYNDTADGREP